jgi:two-component system response regulator (stage 0 sporulation protein F)
LNLFHRHETKPAILIIDDEKDLCDLMLLILKDENIKIEYALSLKEGQKIWSRKHFPVVLLDNNLPDGSGLELIERNPPLLMKSKVILITADGPASLHSRAEDAGIRYFIMKPFSLKQIRELIKRLLLENTASGTQ